MPLWGTKKEQIGTADSHYSSSHLHNNNRRHSSLVITMISLTRKELQIIECCAAAMGVECGAVSHLLKQSLHMAGAVGEKVPWPQFAGFWFGGLAGAVILNGVFINEVETSLTRENKYLKDQMERQNGYLKDQMERDNKWLKAQMERENGWLKAEMDRAISDLKRQAKY